MVNNQNNAYIVCCFEMEIQVNYELASLHAALEDDVYVDLPRGF